MAECLLADIENLRDTGNKLVDFYNADQPTPLWKTVSKALTERSLREFKVVD